MKWLGKRAWEGHKEEASAPCQIDCAAAGSRQKQLRSNPEVDCSIDGPIALSVGASQIPQAEWRYPQARLDRIVLQLGIVTGSAATATGGDREKAIKVRNAAMERAKTTLGRVRFHYCSASRDADKTPELAKLDFQPRRMPGKTEKKPATNQAATPATAKA